MKVRRFGLLGLIFMGIAVLLLGICGVLTIRTNQYKASALSAKGTVVKMEYERGKKGGTYRPVVEFQTQTGEKVRFTNRVSTNPPSHHEGETVEVLYPPDHPKEATINSFIDLYLGSLITGFIGAVWLAIAGGMLLMGAFHR